MTAPVAASTRHLMLRPAWLALHHEAALQPELAIIDPHHHFWVEEGVAYRPADYAADVVASGHRITASVHLECRQNYRDGGDPALAPIGETESVVREVALPIAAGASRIAAGIVVHADLILGDGVGRVLDAQIAAGEGRVRGLRYATVSHADPSARGAMLNRQPGLMAEPAFRAGFAALAPRGLSFDAWIYHTQILELAHLARAFPETTIVLDHLGGVLAIGPYAGRRDEVHAAWARHLRTLAACPNVRVKIGGMGMRLWGFGFEAGGRPPTSERLAAAWKPYVETAIECFGADRCMLESNFPVDKVAAGYGIVWNAFKRLTSTASDTERAGLFHDTAAAVYRL